MTANASTSPEPAALSETSPSLWRRLARRKLALTGLAVIALCLAGAVLAPWIAPYDPNEQHFDGLGTDRYHRIEHGSDKPHPFPGVMR